MLGRKAGFVKNSFRVYDIYAIILPSGINTYILKKVKIILLCIERN